jgi:molybdopterin/thiamine biosynthesis adenylyltransferase
MQAPDFDYATAFSRNIGWLTAAEQARLREKRVAIAGLGGVGGEHVVTLSRLGLCRFHLADFDDFGLHNMNRQAGAFMSTLGEQKLDVMMRVARDINPEAELQAFPDGVNESNLDRFLEGVDLYVDGLDFFVLGVRRKVFAACRERGIPAITAAPLGMGMSFLYFDPKGMSFEDYFQLEGHSEFEQYARFAAGLSPAMLNRHYLVAPEAVNLPEKRGPSTGMAIKLCAGFIGTSALKLLLGRGELPAAPWSLHFDAYQLKFKRCWRPGGNRHPLQRLLLKLMRPVFDGAARSAAPGKGAPT